MLDSIYYGGGTAGNAYFVVDVLQVVFDCFPADDQGFCDLGIGYGQFGIMAAWLFPPEIALLLITADDEDLSLRAC
jgi:hypothetical protein